MIKKLFTFLNSRLWIRVLIPIFLIVILVMFSILWYNISFQNSLGMDQAVSQNGILAQAIEGGMFESLAIGDNDRVRIQFKQLNEKMKDIKVFVYNSKGIISFSTDTSAVGNFMENYIGAKGNKELGSMLETGIASELSSPTTLDGKEFVMKNNSFMNEARCFQCHDQGNKVLGGISVLSSMTAMKKNIQKGKNTNVLIAVTGFFVILIIVWMFFYFLVNKKILMVLDAISFLRKKDFTRDHKVGWGMK